MAAAVGSVSKSVRLRESTVAGSSGGAGPSRSPFGRASRGPDGLPLTDQHRLRCEGG